MSTMKSIIDHWKEQIFKNVGGSRTAATSKMERFVIILNCFQPLTIITKHSILDVAAALDLPLKNVGVTKLLQKKLTHIHLLFCNALQQNFNSYPPIVALYNYWMVPLYLHVDSSILLFKNFFLNFNLNSITLLSSFVKNLDTLALR